MARIVLGITGSIAAYRSADIANQLTQAGHQVDCIMTRSALEFITPLTLKTLSHRPVISNLWDESQGWQPGHIELADAADLLLIAPATAHCIAQLALGLASDALTSIALATRAPLLIAPAMNGKMWQHPATQAHCQTLSQRGTLWIQPKTGLLACGYEGVGKLADVSDIVTTALHLLSLKKA
jgi:phosphopantothenoylcysteine decarboxylase/phosphopantothenoylcysteine decarboxylase/phosphopantothenate--cysteine ligase